MGDSGSIKIRCRIQGVNPARWEAGETPLAACSGDDCACRRGEDAHPPVMAAYLPEIGAYHEVANRCTASIRPGRGQMRRICGEPATRQVADVMVCDTHYRRVRQWIGGKDERFLDADMERERRRHAERLRLDREHAHEQMALNRQLGEQQKEFDRERARLRAQYEADIVRAVEAARAESSVVYYVRRDSDGLIKIGTSRTLAKRLATLKRESGSLRLIATVGGAHREENALHRQFAELRAEGEWFRPELPLLEHVYALMKKCPLEASPGLPPILERRAIGSMINKIKMEPVMEMRRQHEAYREEQRRKRRERKQAQQAQIAADPAA